MVAVSCVHTEIAVRLFVDVHLFVREFQQVGEVVLY